MSAMEDNWEEDLQRSLERDIPGSADKDSQAYRLVFDALQREPEFQLSAKFSDNVLQRLAVARGRDQYTWFAIVILGFVIAAGVSIALTGFRPDFGFLRHISKYSGLFAFGAVFIIFLQWVDKKLVREKEAGV